MHKEHVSFTSSGLARAIDGAGESLMEDVLDLGGLWQIRLTNFGPDGYRANGHESSR